MAVYALLVGIDAYPAAPLRGCVADVRAAAAFLAPAADPRILLDAAATRAALVDGWRGHLAQAGPGDSAVFWFSGHGRTRPVRRAYEHLEPSGESQSLVTVDSADGTVPDLLDQELGLLIGEVAARGAHVVAVLDCCHSGGATREVTERVRGLPRLAGPASPEDLLPGVLARPPAPDSHVRLAACGELQLAFEDEVDGGGYRGRFSHALLASLGTLGGASYRDLTAAVAARIERRPAPGRPRSGQTPVVYPPLSPLVDQPFLGGVLATAPTPATLRYSADGWQVDRGLCHGLEPARDGRGAEFTVHVPPGTPPTAHPAGPHQAPAGSAPHPPPTIPGTDSTQRRVRAHLVEPDRSLVRPLGWEPETGTPYPVTLRGLPLALLRVDVGESPELVDAIGRWAPSVRPVGRSEAELRITGTAHAYQLTDLRGWALAAPGPAAHVARQLEHYAWWRQLRALKNPLGSRLAGLVDLCAAPAPGAPARPWTPDRPVHLAYRGAGPPQVHLSLVNRSDTPLWCVLLDLTDRYRSHAGLFPGAWVGPAPHRAAVLDGEAVAFSLPPGRALRPGARATDWLKLIVSETPLNPGPFELPALAEAGRHPGNTIGGYLDLGALGGTRDAGPAGGRVGDWGTVTVEVRTIVP
ncbi:caspase family protein [Longispora sp. NPDC051575]|uniref:caspase family protein n=1 Tax=Longispora sp. NPDC051575 TaxID=3154943 RepID=UPI0034262BEA